MLIDMEEINGRSLMNVFFDIEGNPLKFNDLDYMNLVFTHDGVFLVLKSEFGVTYERTGQPYKNLSLRKYEFDWACKSFLPKASKEIFVDILECFKYVVGKTKDELFIILYWDKVEKQYIMDVVKLQIVSGGAVKYAYNKTLEMEERYVKYLEIHSHNTMAAGFSGTDNNDESNRTLYYCGVIGKINEHSNIYNVDQKFRVWTGERFRELPAWEIFDTYVPTPGVNAENKKRLDQILAISKAAKEKNKLQSAISVFPGLGQNNNQTPGKKTMLLPSTGREVDIIKDHMNIFDSNPLNDKFPTVEELSEMDDDELEEWGIIWSDFEEDEVEQLGELIGERRGDGHSIN